MNRITMVFQRTLSVLAAMSLASFASAAGILAPTDQTLPPLRVTNHLVDVVVSENIAITKVRQTFRNDTQQRLEATYVFPLPDQADLTDFQMTFNGKMVKGEVLPAELARQIYESIVRQSRDPGLIEFIGRRLLRMRVFPIEPGSDTTIQMQYQQVCRPISEMMGYHYPLRTTEAAGQAYGTVRFAVNLETSSPLKNIWSPTHSVEIVREGEYRAKVAYEASGGSLNDDFLLLYATDSSDLGLSLVAHKPASDQSGHFVLMLTPKQLWPQGEYQPQDVVFVLDTSGSMAGDKLEQAKASLRFCIDKLDERDRFAVVRFSTGFDELPGGVQVATREAKTQAKDWIGKFSAAGGTNILDTLMHVMSMKPNADEEPRPFVVVFLTDGQGNQTPEETMQKLASAAYEGVRIFPFGVGHDVNTKLLDQLSEKFTGRPTYVQPGENLELVLGDFFGVISRPVMTNLKLDLPAVGVTERFPVALGDLYHGQQLVIAGKFDNAASGPVKLTATRSGKPVEYVWPGVSFTNTAEASYVPAVWAGRKIAYLLDQLRLHGENNEMICEVIELSQRYGIQTPYTSWLVNPEGMPIPMPVAIRRGMEPSAQGGGTFGGGGGGRNAAPGSRMVGDRLRAAAGHELLGDIPLLDFDSSLGFGALSAADAEAALDADSGKFATLFATQTAQMREARSKDDSRLDPSVLAVQQINGVWYHRVNGVLVDERFTEQTQIVVVKFGTDAYFDLVSKLPELQPVLARQVHVLAVVKDAVAVFIAEKTGAEKFSTEQVEQLGLSAR